MSETLPEPPLPDDVDLRGLQFMPLDVVRLADSDFTALTSGEEFKAGTLLWGKAWLQVPAGSLPNDDRVLAHLSGAGARWRKVKAMALHGFVLCRNGRLYHPVIVEKALEAWAGRVEHREAAGNEAERQRRSREQRKEIAEKLRRLGLRFSWNTPLSRLREMLAEAERGDGPRDGGGPAGVTGKPPVTEPVTPPVTTGHEPDTAKTGTGTGTGNHSLPAQPVTEPPGDETDLGRIGERACALARIDRAKIAVDFGVVFAWRRDGIGAGVIWAAIERVAMRPGYSPPGSLNYFDRPVRQAAAEARAGNVTPLPVRAGPMTREEIAAAGEKALAAGSGS